MHITHEQRKNAPQLSNINMFILVFKKGKEVLAALGDALSSMLDSMIDIVRIVFRSNCTLDFESQ